MIAAKPNAAEMANNYDWFKNISFIEFLRDTGKHITVNYMMAKDSVKKRIEGEVGMSYTEFAYQLMQGYDFYWLYQNKNCKLQMGGSDQWGNITTGTELVRRKAGGEAFAFTCPLITKADGGKFGKTEKGNVWLDASLTTPYQFYQFWLNASDEDAEKWIKIFTPPGTLDKDSIEEKIVQHKSAPQERILQKNLATEITRFVHGQEALSRSEHFTKIFFGNAVIENLLEMNDEDYTELSRELPYSPINKSRFDEGYDIITFLAETNIFPSKGEARKSIQGGGISINRKKIEDVQFAIDKTLLLHNKYLLVQKGKKELLPDKSCVTPAFLLLCKKYILSVV